MSKNTLRYKRHEGWGSIQSANTEMLGMFELILYLEEYFEVKGFLDMIEIGSYMGESTALFASSQLFREINTIDPHEGVEEFNDLFGYTWEDVKREWKINTRHYDDIITLHNQYSYDAVNIFEDSGFDFIYIDGAHDYESVKRDINLFLPKLNKNGIIAGHDYHGEAWPDVCNAVMETVGKPDRVFKDSSWVKSVSNI